MRTKLDSLISRTKKPVAILDLDGTLFDVTYRHIAILNKFIEIEAVREQYPAQCAIVKRLTPQSFLYSIEATLNQAGIDRYSEFSANFTRQAESFWFKHFFTDEYVVADAAYPGAVSFVQHLHRQGVHIVYLSGRDIPNMSKGTIMALEKDDFPHTGHNITMCLKPAYGLDDYLFKKQSLEMIRSEGTVILTIDNEPANVKLFLDEFPDAMNFHYDSQYARAMELSGPNFYRIKNFKELGF